MTHARVAAGVLPRLDIGAPRDASLPSASPGPVLQRWLDGDERLVASGGREGPNWWMHWPNLGTFSFGSSGPVRVVPAAPGLGSQLEDSFLRGVVPVVLLARGCEAFHASAVSDARGVVMFCASSGTGKSTTALALAATGLRHWSDDTVVYRLVENHPVAVRLPCAARVDDDARAAMTPAIVATDEEAERPLRRVYLLSRDGGLDPSAPAIEPIAPAACFDRLLAHAHPFELGDDARRRRFIESLLVVARVVGVFECRFAPSLTALPALVSAIRAHLEAS